MDDCCSRRGQVVSALKVEFYCHDSDPSQQISRVPACVWEQKVKDTPAIELANQLVGLSGEDHDALGESVLEDILIALELGGKLQC